jgi:hypothetical protein
LSCITTFEKLDTLQQKFKNKLEIILVNSLGTGDEQSKIVKFFEKRPLKLKVAIEDSIASLLFPHYEIPHYAWIDASGKVQAITSSEVLNESNIQKILNGEDVNMAEKRDFFPDRFLDLGNQVKIDETLLNYSIFKRGKLDDLSSYNAVRKISALNVRGLAMRNVSLLEIFEASTKFKKGFGSQYGPKRLIIEAKNPSKLYFSGDINKEIWEKANFYTYEIVVPESDVENLHEKILNDLNKYSGYYGRIEKRKVMCLVLTDVNSSVNIAKEAIPSISLNKERLILTNAPGYLLTDQINRYTDIKYPIINRMNSEKLANVSVDLRNANSDKLKQDLLPYGIKTKTK